MLAIVKFPNDREVEQLEDDISEEIDAVFDFLEERTAEGAEPSDVLMAMVVVVKMITKTTGELEVLN